MPNTASKNKNIRQIWQMIPVMKLVEFITNQQQEYERG